MKYNDFELIALAQEGNEDAINMIYEKYRPIIIKKSKLAFLNTPHCGIDISDIMQEGFIGLDEAIKNFSQDMNATFYTFASICINREIASYLKKINNTKGKILNEAIAIDDKIEKVIGDKTDIEMDFLKKDDDENRIENFKKVLTCFESKVLELKLHDYTLDEIAIKLGKDKKAIYNTFQRIKNKFKNFQAIDN